MGARGWPGLVIQIVAASFGGAPAAPLHVHARAACGHRQVGPRRRVADAARPCPGRPRLFILFAVDGDGPVARTTHSDPSMLLGPAGKPSVSIPVHGAAKKKHRVLGIIRGTRTQRWSWASRRRPVTPPLSMVDTPGCRAATSSWVRHGSLVFGRDKERIRRRAC